MQQVLVLEPYGRDDGGGYGREQCDAAPSRNVAVGAGFSDRGYQFVAVVGEILAAGSGREDVAAELFDPGRFTATLGDPETRRA